MKRAILILALSLVAGRAWAQDTIPEALAKAGLSLGGYREAELPPPPPVNSLLSQTDLIVRGIAGAPQSYLSQDQRADTRTIRLSSR
jgi:hypothetical protein